MYVCMCKCKCKCVCVYEYVCLNVCDCVCVCHIYFCNRFEALRGLFLRASIENASAVTILCGLCVWRFQELWHTSGKESPLRPGKEKERGTQRERERGKGSERASDPEILLT